MRKGRWTKKEEDKLTDLYPDTPNAKIAALLNRDARAVANKAFKMGLKKDNVYLGQLPRSRNSGSFKKGQKPWNAGLKLAGTGRVHFRGTFEKGNKTWNTRPIGSMRYNGRDGWYRKSGEPNQWVSYARFVWEMHTGKEVPKGHIVRLIDGNPHHVCMKNIECISRAENALRNSIHRYPEEYVKVRQMIGQINRVTNNMAKSGGVR